MEKPLIFVYKSSTNTCCCCAWCVEKSPERPGLNKYSNSGERVKIGLLLSHPLGTAWGRHPFSLAQKEHCRTLFFRDSRKSCSLSK